MGLFQLPRGNRTSIITEIFPDGVLALALDTHELRAHDGETVGGFPVGGLSGGSNFVLSSLGTSPTENAANARAAYNEAKALTPNGNALSATNRAVAIIPPGHYDFGTNGELVLDTEFVDVVGLSPDREHQYFYASHNGSNTGVIRQTANDVRIANLWLHLTSSSAESTISARPAAYFPSTNRDKAVVTNCRFSIAVDSAGGTMRRGIEYSGRFERVRAGQLSFGAGSGAEFSGFALDCEGGELAFGALGTFSGLAERCRASTGSFASFASTFASTGRVYYCSLYGGGATFPNVSAIAGAQIVLCIEEDTGNVKTQIGT